jgi:hypothetical protein
MSNSNHPAVSAAWHRVADKPLAAAATAAVEDSTLSQAQCRGLVQVADDVEDNLLRFTVLPPSSFEIDVPQLMLETVSSAAESRQMQPHNRVSNSITQQALFHQYQLPLLHLSQLHATKANALALCLPRIHQLPSTLLLPLQVAALLHLMAKH